MVNCAAPGHDRLLRGRPRAGLHRRLEAIARFYDTSFKELAADGLVVMSFAGKDAIVAEA